MGLSLDLITTLNGKTGKSVVSSCPLLQLSSALSCINGLYTCFAITTCSPNYEKEFGCRKQLMDEKYVSKHPIRRDSNTWKLLLEQNRFDVHLYDFAKELFSHQSYIFGL